MAPLDQPAAQGYTFLEKLNSGSFGDVYLAQSNAGGEYLAIKVLYGDDRKSIDAELRFCKFLDHPNIVKTYDVLEFSDGQRWVVSEFCENGDLFGSILPMEGVGDETRIKKYFGQLVDAVAYLHSYGIVHRDIKPENILLSKTDDVKLCDFGLSKLETESWDEGVGTVPYMSPEVYTLGNTAMYNPKATDIWSLGCTLYTMLVGMLPWEAPCLQDADYEAFRENMGRFDRPEWSEDLHDLLHHMLHWNPSKRPTITELQASMRRAHGKPWILPKSWARSTMNLMGVFPRMVSYGRLDEEMRRPRSPPGAIHPHDYVIFRDGDGDASDAGGAGSDWHVGSPMSKSVGGGFFPDLRRVLPPPRRTRYDSTSCEIEFNPYLVSDSPLVLRSSRLPSVRSSSSASADDYENDEEEDDEGSWFAAGAMSFSTLPRFDSCGGDAQSSGRPSSSADHRGDDGNGTTSTRASSTSFSSPSPNMASGATTKNSSSGVSASPPRFVLGGDDDDEEEDWHDGGDYASKSGMEQKVSVAEKKISADAGEESDTETDQGIGGSLPDECELHRHHYGGSSSQQIQIQDQDYNQNLDQKPRHRVRWGDLSDRDMSFSVLPRFGSLALGDDRDGDDEEPRDCDCCGSGSEDSGVEGVRVPRSKPIAVPGGAGTTTTTTMRAARMNSRGSTDTSFRA